MLRKLREEKIEKERSERKDLVVHYIELTAICFVTLLLVFLLRNWYRGEQALKKNIPVMRGTIAEINTDELSAYVMENENAVFYVCSSEKKGCRSFEKKLKVFVEDNALQQDITYLNITEVDDQENYLLGLSQDYQAQGVISTYPTFLLFQDQKIQSFVELTNVSDQLREVENFLIVNGVMGD